jgi:hypothetical protein
VAALAHLPAQAQPAPPKENRVDDLFFPVSFQLSPVEVALKAVPEVETVVPMLEVGTETKPRYAIMAPAN